MVSHGYTTTINCTYSKAPIEWCITVGSVKFIDTTHYGIMVNPPESMILCLDRGSSPTV